MLVFGRQQLLTVCLAQSCKVAGAYEQVTNGQLGYQHETCDLRQTFHCITLGTCGGAHVNLGTYVLALDSFGHPGSMLHDEVLAELWPTYIKHSLVDG